MPATPSPQTPTPPTPAPRSKSSASRNKPPFALKSSLPTGSPPDIILISGECYFVDKVHNIEQAHGQVAIIVDQTIEDPDYLIMSDSGFGRPPHIPSTLIAKK